MKTYRFRAVLADADDTLFDFVRGEEEALRRILPSAQVDPTPDNIRLYQRINAGWWEKLERGETTQDELQWARFRDFLAALGLPAEEDKAKRVHEAFAEELGNQRWLMPGAEAFCRRVSQKLPICLVTNGIAKIQHSRFDSCVLRPYFSDMIISGEVGYAKPDRRIVELALKSLGIADPAETVFIGDSLKADIAAARAAGTASLLFTNGRVPPAGHGADYAASSLEEAADWILAHAQGE